MDGIVELWFADDDVVQAGFDSDVADKLIVDELNFLNGLTGGPVTAEAPHAPWPFKLWVLARWAEPAPDAVERWAKQLVSTYDGALDWSVDVLVPGAKLLVREALHYEEHIPEVAVSVGFTDEASARTAASSVGESLENISDVLTRVQGCVAEEIVII